LLKFFINDIRINIPVFKTCFQRIFMNLKTKAFGFILLGLIISLSSSHTFGMSDRGRGDCEAKFNRKTSTVSCACTGPNGQILNFNLSGISSSSGKKEKCLYELSIIGSGPESSPSGDRRKNK
jgi:hypothetical protein